MKVGLSEFFGVVLVFLTFLLSFLSSESKRLCCIWAALFS